MTAKRARALMTKRENRRIDRLPEYRSARQELTEAVKRAGIPVSFIFRGDVASPTIH